MRDEEAMEICEKVFNHIGLMYDTEIMRCIGFAEDEDDYYYVALDKNGHKRYCSMVGAFESLKDLNYPRYKMLEEQMCYWGANKVDSFVVERIK